MSAPDDSPSDPASNALARILFVGDVVGPLGIAAVEALVPDLRVEHGVDFCIANGENAAGSGAGIDLPLARRLLDAGVDAITTGNHAYDASGAEELFASGAPVVRPENLAGPDCGRASIVLDGTGIKLGVVNVIGSSEGHLPVAAGHGAARAVEELEPPADVVVVDVHASWPAEKLAAAWTLDGRVCAVVGTHTHVPTADARLLPGGTAYVSDVGMTGARDGLIGFRPDEMVSHIQDGAPTLPAPVAAGEAVLMAVLVTATIDGRAGSIERVTAHVDTAGADRREPLAARG